MFFFFRLIEVPSFTPSKEVFVKIVRELFSDGEINWGRVVTVFCFAGMFVLKVSEASTFLSLLYVVDIPVRIVCIKSIKNTIWCSYSRKLVCWFVSRQDRSANIKISWLNLIWSIFPHVSLGSWKQNMWVNQNHNQLDHRLFPRKGAWLDKGARRLGKELIDK